MWTFSLPKRGLIIIIRPDVCAGEFDEATMRHTQTVRPYFDVVEEYTRSLEEYRERTHPTDEQMGECIPNDAYENYGPLSSASTGG